MLSIAIAFFTSLLALLPVAAAQAAFPGANGRIAHISGDEIYTVDPEGFNDLPLQPGAGPAWSPDGTKLAFGRPASSAGPAGIYTSNADASNLTFVTPGGAAEWSPDGTKLVYIVSAHEGRTYDIWVVNVDGTGATNLTNNPCEVRDTGPSWSPDGTKIAFSRDTIDDCNAEDPVHSGNHIYVMNPDGSGQALLSVGINPNWSPDGRRIVVSGVSVVNADGSGFHYLGVPGSDPAWSPDGRQIAFERETGVIGFANIFVMNADGSNPRQITFDDPDSPGFNFFPSWQPLPTAPYRHPQSASQLRVSLVPAFKPCGTGGNPSHAKHSPPLATNSCNPPKPGSVLATVGVSSQSSAQMTVVPGDTDPTNGNQANVSLTAALSDIQSTAGGDYNPNASGADLTAVTRLRFTDKANGYGGLPATATEYDFKVPIACSSTPDPSVGSTCSANTTANALMPSLIQEQRQTVVQAFRVRIDDSGANGIRGDSDDRIFATQGVFIP